MYEIRILKDYNVPFLQVDTFDRPALGKFFDLPVELGLPMTEGAYTVAERGDFLPTVFTSYCPRGQPDPITCNLKDRISVNVCNQFRVRWIIEKEIPASESKSSAERCA